MGWYLLIVGAGPAAEAVPYLAGRKVAGFGRPRVGGWASATAGTGVFLGGLVEVAGWGDTAALAAGCLVLAGLVLFLCGAPVTRFGRSRRG
ncbi:hypothetical protein OG599_19565 [Streptomyces sp. NBC_01335]|uniref:hypothetical protein n=1 Tax=Streptomyces sp. NBC_01335 TaxID=2903828 RepID=UPI002E0D1789|nr:hypothetical protein OG599_19565 [Streptomyces sp. NBC_01335]